MILFSEVTFCYWFKQISLKSLSFSVGLFGFFFFCSRKETFWLQIYVFTIQNANIIWDLKIDFPSKGLKNAICLWVGIIKKFICKKFYPFYFQNYKWYYFLRIIRFCWTKYFVQRKKLFDWTFSWFVFYYHL